MPKFYVGPVGLEYNDEGYNSYDGSITGVGEIVETEAEAQQLVDRLTIKAIRGGHYAYDNWSEWDQALKDYVEIDPKKLTDEELLRTLDHSDSSVPSRLYSFIRG